MGQTLATLTAITKEIYTGSLNKQLNDDVVALRRIERTSDGVSDVGGKYVVFPIHTRRNTGIGARNENEALPTAGQQSYAAGRVGLKFQYGAVEMTGQAITLIDTKPQAFISAVDTEMRRLREDLAVDLNRQVYGDGTGAVATVSVLGTTVNTLTVSDASLAELGMKVDLVTLPSTVIWTGRTVTAVDTVTNIITVDGAPFSSSVGQIMTRTGNLSREWTGLGAIVAATGTLYNVDPTVEPVWKAVVDANGGTGRAVSEGLLNKVTDKVKVNGGKVTLALTSYGVRRAYANLLQQQRSYVNVNGKFDGGYTALSYSTPDGEIPMVVDRMAPKGKIWFINEDEIKLFRQKDWDFMNYGASDTWKLKQSGGNDFDAYVARLFQYSELGTFRRNTHALVSDLNEQ